jgi:hypothetical protein
MNSLRRKSLVGDILQNFHHLLCIISFAHKVTSKIVVMFLKFEYFSQ